MRITRQSKKVSFLIPFGLAALLLALFIGGSAEAQNAGPGEAGRITAVQAAPIGSSIPEFSTPLAVGSYGATAVTVLANKSVVLFSDDDTSGGATPGDTMRYTVAITNSGVDDALGMTFTDTIDAHTTLSGVAHVSPIAFADSYTSLGNVGISVPAVNGVLANDVDPDNNSGTLAVVAAAGGTSSGGAFSISANGSFSYQSPAGFEGGDSFTYTLTDGDPLTPNDTGVVNITVNEVIWFVDKTAGAGGTGVLSNPFNDLTGASGYSNAADDPGDIVFIYDHQASGAYNGAITLQSNQYIVGQGATASIAAITGITVPPHSNALPATGGGKPLLSNTAGNNVALAQNNTIRGLSLDDSTGGYGFVNNGGTVGNLTISETNVGGTGGAVNIANGGTLAVTLEYANSTGSPGSGINLDGVAGSFTVGTSSISGPTNNGLRVNNSSATVNFQGGTKTINTGAQTAVNLTNNTGTVNFTGGGLDIDTTTGLGFNATGGGTVNVTGTANTINSIAATAVNINGSTIGASGITFRSISSAGATNGIFLKDTGSNGFSVTGNGGTCTSEGTCSGGTIKNTTSDGIVLQNVSNISFSNLLIDNTGRHGVHVPDATSNTGVNNFSFLNGRLEDIGNANDESGMNFGWDAAFVGGLGFVPPVSKLSGTALINNTLFLRVAKHNLEVENGNGTLNLTVSNSTFQNGVNSLCGGSNCEGSAILLRADGDGNGGSPVITLNVQSTTFNNIDLDGIDIGADPGGTVYFIADDITGINNSQMDNLIDVAADGGPTGDFEMRLTDFTSDANHRGTVIFIKVDGTSTMDGHIGVVNLTDNVISGSTIGRGIDIFVDGDIQVEDPSVRMTIQNTVISNTEFEGLFAQIQDGDTDAANLHLTVTNVDVTTAPGFGFVEGMGFYAGVTAGDDGVMCLDIDGSTSVSPAFFDDIRLRHRYSTIFHVEGYAGGAMDTAAIEAFISGTNAGISTVDVSITNGAPGITGTACNNPVLTNVFAGQPQNTVSNQNTNAGYSLSAVYLLSKLSGPEPAVSGTAVASQNRPDQTSKPDAAPEQTPATVPAFSGETININIGTLPAGKTVYVIFDATIDTPASAGDLVSQLCNSATVTGSNFSNVTTNQVCTQLQAGVIVIVKDAIPDGPTDFGFTATGLVPGTFSLDDDADPTLPNTTLFVNVDPGQYTVAEDDPSGVGFSLGNLVCDDDASSVPSTENVGTRTATINLEPNESVTCTFTNVSGPDLQISKDDGGVLAVPGDTISYTLTYTNAAGSNATGVVLTETVPANTTFNAGASTAGWACSPDSSAGSVCTLTLGALNIGSSGSAIFAVDVINPVAAGAAVISNTAEIGDDGANGPDQNGNDNIASDTTPVTAAPDMQLSKDDGGITAVPGDVITYTLTYTNAGNQGATNVTLTETVPANTTFNAAASTAGWSCGDGAPAGASCTINLGALAGGGTSGSAIFAVNVNLPLAAGVTQVDNEAGVLDDGTNGADTNPGNNVDTDSTPITAAPDLQVRKINLGSSSTPGGNISYLIVMTNTGTQNATGVVLTDTIPANTTFHAGGSTPAWSCADNAPAGTECTADISATLGGEFLGNELQVVSLVLAVTVDNPYGGGPVVTNTAEIGDDGASGPDLNPADNSFTETTPIDGPVTITSISMNPATINENESAELSVTIEDIGVQESHVVDIDWGDGLTETLNLVTGTLSFTRSHQYLDDDPTGTASDMYTVNVTVTEPDGDMDSDSTSVTVNNVAPVLSNYNVTEPVDENGFTTLSGTITDPGSLDTFELVVDWGDGSTMTYTYGAGTTTFTETHQYLDDDPTATPSDDFTINLTLTDDDTGQTAESPTVIVNNVAPQLQGTAVSTPINENDTATVSGNIVDPGTLDTFQLVVDWGDGSTMTYTYPSGTAAFTETHQYLDDDPSGTAVDIYTVNLTLTDDDTGSDSTSLPVTVNNLLPSLTNLAATPLIISETATISLTGVISDIGSQDTFSLTVDWKDGNIETFAYPAGTSNFLETHTYLDDGFLDLLVPFVIDATLEDDDLGSDVMSVTVEVNNVAPTLSNVSATSIFENDSSTLSAVINEISPLDTFSLTVTWGDGAVVTYSYPAGTTAISETHQFLDDDPTGTPADGYTMTLTLVDDNGGMATATTGITVTNVTPTFTSLATNSPINENDFLTLTGIISDVGSLDTLTMTLDWGDGMTETVTFANIVGGVPFTASHQYLDDDPTNTPSDTYTVSLMVLDDDTGFGTADLPITVQNVAPTVAASALPTTVVSGAPIAFTGVFSDIGTLDTHTILWDFGDGITVTGSLTPSHIFAGPGDYNVTLTITDDDQGVGTAIVQVSVEMPTSVSLSAFGGQTERNNVRTAVFAAALLFGLLGIVVGRKRLIAKP